MEKCPRSVHRGFKTAASSWSHSTVVLVWPSQYWRGETERRGLQRTRASIKGLTQLNKCRHKLVVSIH